MTGPGQRVPLVDLKAQYASIKPEVDAAIARVVENASFILGPEVAAFEAAFATHAAAAGTVSVASGTAALHLALLACGVGPGDEVITASHTFTATGEAIVHAGARPVFADIDPVSQTLDPEHVEAAVTRATRAIIAVHLYGQAAHMSALRAIARGKGLRLIEDAAQAHGAEWEGSRAGSMGDLGCFSFYPGKNLGAYGDAGAVTGDDGDLLARVRKLRDHGRTTKYEHDEIGYGERMDALQAAILSVKLRHLEAWTEARRAAARRYDRLLAAAGAPVERPQEVAGARHVYHLYVVRVPDRDRVLQRLQAAGVGAGVHYPIPLHRQPAYRHLVDDRPLPETERAADAVLSLPMYPELTDDQAEYVVEQLCRAVA